MHRLSLSVHRRWLLGICVPCSVPHKEADILGGLATNGSEVLPPVVGSIYPSNFKGTHITQQLNAIVGLKW